MPDTAADATPNPGPVLMDERNTDQAAFWNGPAGELWVSRQEKQDSILAPISSILGERANAAPGERVCDIGCGCGATSIELADRVGPTGHVLGIDISQPMLARARQRAPHGAPLAFIHADATVHPFDRGQTDLLFSRFGVMFFAQPQRSFANMRTALRPGGRIAFACWREPRANPWLVLPVQAAYRHVPKLPEVGPDEPGPFAFANQERVRGILADAGFIDVGLEAADFELDIAAGRGLDAAVEAAVEVGPARRALEGQPEALVDAARQSIRAALAAVQKGQTVPLAAAIWIVTARSR